ncbi:DUF3971 domain-containing protein [Limimaricola variabilis]
MPHHPIRSRPSHPRRPRGLGAATVLRRGIGAGAGLLTALIGLPLALALTLPLLLVGQTVTAPGWITARVEAQAATMLAGGGIDFGEIALTLGHDLHPRVTLHDTVLRDADGGVLARVPEVEALFSPRGLLFERSVLAQEVVLRGAEIGLRRDPDGRLALRFEAAGGAGGEGLAGLLTRIDRLAARPGLAALERIRIEDLAIDYVDDRARRRWTSGTGRLALDMRAGMRLTGRLPLTATRQGRPGLLALSYDRPGGGEDAELRLILDRVSSRDIATQHPALNVLSVLDAPVSARLRGRIGMDGTPGPVSATLRLDAGALAPRQGGEPLRFDGAELALRFDPDTAHLALTRVAARGEMGRIEGHGEAYLRDFASGWPETVEAELELDRLALSERIGLPGPVELDEAAATLRLRPAPFDLEIESLSATDAIGGARVAASGRVTHDGPGWQATLEAHADQLGRDRLLAHWPPGFRPGTREWIAGRIPEARLRDLALTLDRAPGEAPRIRLSHGFEKARLRPLDGMPPITGAVGRLVFGEGALHVELDAGEVTAPEGGRIDLAGSRFAIPELGRSRPQGRIELAGEGAATAMLSLIDQPPLRVMQKAGKPVDMIDGTASARAVIELPLGGPVTPEQVNWAVDGVLSDATSGAILPGRRIAATRLEVTAGPERLEITGPLTLDGLPADVTYLQPLGAGAGAARLDGSVELSQRFLDTFGIALPEDSLGGSGHAHLSMTLPRGAPPVVELTSDLAGVALRIPALGWAIAPGTTGRIEVAATLDATPRVDRIALDAGGLSARGSLRLQPQGGIDRARFDRLRLSDWLDVTADLVGRGAGETVGIEIRGGALDLRRASFGSGGGGDGGPVEIALDRLRVTEAVTLTGFRGSFSTRGGFSGRFGARVNGAAPVSGLVVPDGGRAAVRVTGADAGAVLRAAGLYGTATGGVLDLMLLPEDAPGHYSGTLDVAGLRVRDAPAIAQLLDAISVVGLLQQLDGKGLAFDRILASFRLTPETLDIAQASATGPGLGISLDGRYSLGTRRMAFAGVVSPFYLVNSLGSFLTRPGEGLIGFNYTLGGTPEAPQVSVNPLSALTPGMFREIFRRAPPT